MALATSFAPIPQAMKQPNTQPVIKKKEPYSKIISIYSNGHGIYEVLAELEKGARELGKLTLEEQTERAKNILRGGETGKRALLLAEKL